jgi:FkbM family methyltransferase
MSTETTAVWTRVSSWMTNGRIDFIVRRIPEKLAWRAVRAGVQRSVPRTALNWLYNRLSTERKSAFHRRFRSALWQCDFCEFEWNVSFLGASLRMPIAPPHAALEWELAVSIWHDAEIKTTYEHLLKAGRVRTMFDVGANHGLHSLLFLSQGVRTASFEPNPSCHAYFRRVAQLNGYTCDIQPVALGAEAGTAELCFPPDSTWLGSVRQETKQDLAQHYAVERIEVSVETLDHAVERIGAVPQLIKIDVEGAEIGVLRGATGTLRAHQPIILFEANADRRAMHRFLCGEGYRVVALPFRDPASACSMSEDDLEAAPGTNFGAVPA